MSFVPKENLVDAIRKAIAYSPERKFKQSVELIVVLRDVDPRTPEGRIREIVFLPHPPKKHVTICVVADGDMAVKAREVADRVITREELQGIDRKMAKKIAQTCDWVLVKTDLMGLAGRILGPALGPRGKIPVPMPPNVNVEAFVNRYRSAVMVRTRDQPQVMVRIGTEDMSPEELAENAMRVLQVLEGKLKNPTYNIAKIIVKTTMGPPIEVRLR
ncbi:ribosomal protein L1 [Pyrolobus fumarii 1A]|uniref:Large ribosomal subunit protein uL1 n=1 Tax=Pyrolobus fumarii (strain DSM 11204 / 1A) TaxID=694429 RepID=G0EEN5_PYRF1|nr:50S ribosomal protein L1 [Pyrolobus fumarii]AEM38857.1 ribosomal protein L1 [Pyrolobus fumarii 1A]